jgi:hypothetical protein
MSNKQFFIFLGFVIVVFFGWLYYDSKISVNMAGTDPGPRDVLVGNSDAGISAQIQYLFRFPEPAYDHRHSIGEIETLSSKLGEERNFHVPALTQAEFGMKTFYQFNYSKKMFQDDYCLWVENLRVDFSYNTLNVYVTSSYAVDSCEYKTTLAHENQHVEIHRRVYEKYKKILQDAMAAAKDIPLADRPVTVRSLEEGKARIAGFITGVTDPVFEQFQAELSAEQSELDSPQNYSVLKSQCSNW